MASSVLAKMAVEISANSADFSRSLKSADNSLKTFVGGVQKVAGVAAVAFGAFSFASIGQDVVEITSKFQKFQAVLTNTLGSRSAAVGSMKDIQDFAAKTPFSVDELTSSFVKLVNQGFKPTNDEMRKLGDLAASQGKGFDQLTEAIIDAQTGEFERLKEFGIRAKKEGENVTFTFKDVKTQVDFTGESIRDYVLSLGDAVGVSGSMASISTTLGGKISNLGDNLDQILVAIGSRTSGIVGGFLDWANVALGAVNNALNDQVGALQKEQAELNVLVDSITDVNTTEEARKVLITELNQKYPDFLKNLNAETVTNEQLRGRMEEVNAQFERKILLVAAEKQLSTVSEKIIDTVNREAEARKALAEAQKSYAENQERQNRVAAAGGTTINKSALEIQQAEAVIKSALEERKGLQDQLRESTKAYSDALGLFNTNNNDYFEGQKKATEEDVKANEVRLGLIAALQKQIKALEDAKVSAFSTTEIENFNSKIQDLKDELDLLNALAPLSGFGKKIFANDALKIKTEVEEPTNNLPDNLLPTTIDVDVQPYLDKIREMDQVSAEFHVNEETRNAQRRATQDALNEQQAFATSLAVDYGNAVGESLGQAASGQITFAQAMKKVTADLLKMFLQRALAGIIASAATSGGPPPVAIALAAAGVAAISAIFSKATGVSSGAGAGSAASAPRTNVSRLETRASSNPIEKIEFVIHGNDLVGIANSQNNRNTRLRG